MVIFLILTQKNTLNENSRYFKQQLTSVLSLGFLLDLPAIVLSFRYQVHYCENCSCCKINIYLLLISIQNQINNRPNYKGFTQRFNLKK